MRTTTKPFQVTTGPSVYWNPLDQNNEAMMETADYYLCASQEFHSKKSQQRHLADDLGLSPGKKSKSLINPQEEAVYTHEYTQQRYLEGEGALSIDQWMIVGGPQVDMSQKHNSQSQTSSLLGQGVFDDAVEIKAAISNSLNILSGSDSEDEVDMSQLTQPSPNIDKAEEPSTTVQEEKKAKKRTSLVAKTVNFANKKVNAFKNLFKANKKGKKGTKTEEYAESFKPTLSEMVLNTPTNQKSVSERKSFDNKTSLKAKLTITKKKSKSLSTLDLASELTLTHQSSPGTSEKTTDSYSNSPEYKDLYAAYCEHNNTSDQHNLSPINANTEDVRTDIAEIACSLKTLESKSKKAGTLQKIKSLFAMKKNSSKKKPLDAKENKEEPKRGSRLFRSTKRSRTLTRLDKETMENNPEGAISATTRGEGDMMEGANASEMKKSSQKRKISFTFSFTKKKRNSPSVEPEARSREAKKKTETEYFDEENKKVRSGYFPIGETNGKSDKKSKKQV